jgi:hypothetical protein
MWRKLKFYTASTLFVALLAACGYLYFFGGRRGGIARTVDAPALVREIQQLSELVTVRCVVQKVIGLKEEKVPFGAESVLLLVQANVLAGVDLAALQPNDVTVANNGPVTIRLPAAKVLHVFLDDKQTQVWDRSKTWWTPWVPLNPDLEQNARRAALEAAQATALETGLLAQARANAETTIRSFLRAMGISNTTFVAATATGR